MPPLLLLRQGWEHRALVLAVVVVGLLAMAKRQHETITLLRAAPTVEFRDRVVEKRVVIRGPVRIVKEVVKAPDGTTTTTTTTDRAPETVTTDKDRDKERVEIPQQVPKDPRRTRYVGVGVDPAHPRLWRARTGLTVFGRFDAGMAADFDADSRAVTRPMLEISIRF